MLVLVHGASLALVWSLKLPITLHLGLKLAVLASLLWSLWCAGWLAARSHPHRLRLKPSDEPGAPDRVEVALASGKVVRGSVKEGSLVLADLVVLRWRPDGARWWQGDRSWLLLPDSVPAEAHRQLRVRLRWGRAAPV